MHPPTVYGIETVGRAYHCVRKDAVACTLFARALNKREPKAKREFSATHAWTLSEHKR